MSASPPLISIVITTYNYAQFVNESIMSAALQTYPNIEIIVVDDGSTDNTKHVLDKIRGVTFRYYYKENGGSASARNFGMDRAKGDFVLFLDSDDKLVEGYVESAFRLIKSQPQNVGFVYTQVKHFGDSTWGSDYPEYDTEKLKESNYISATSLFRASVCRHHRYDEAFKVLEDYEYYVALAEDGVEGKLLDKHLLLYRQHGRSKDKHSQERLKIDIRHRMINKHWRFFGITLTIKHNVWYVAYRFYHFFARGPR